MDIVFALIAHGAGNLVGRLMRNLVSAGHKVAVHYDLKSPAEDYQRLAQSFAGAEAVRFARRVRVDWGQWSIVEATLNCLEAIEEAGWAPDYVYLLSGMDYPIRPSAELVAFLARNKGREFIESVPAEQVLWAKTGPQTERYQYRFYFNWRDQRLRFELSFAVQKLLRLKRKFIRGMVPYIGSQWWVLSWDTLKQVMELARQPDIRRFFRTVLVPDELFFQTLVHHLVPGRQIVSRTLTLYQFSDYGHPVVYYRDHLDYLLRQPFFMARKLSWRHAGLRDALDACWRGERQPLPFADEAIGVMSREYEKGRLAYRDGVPGRPVPGRPPRRRYGDLERLTIPYFVVIAQSTAELRLVHGVLSRHPDILCHGQLFHPKHIEFAGGRAAFAGYGAEHRQLRAVSPTNFLADVIRAEKLRLTGFLLRRRRPAHITKIMFELPNPRVILVHGDPFLAFVENLLGGAPLLDDALALAAPAGAAPSLAAQFRDFYEHFRRDAEWFARQASEAARIKPEGSIIEVAVDAPRPAIRLLSAGGTARADVDAAVAPPRRQWLEQIAAGLDIRLKAVPDRHAAAQIVRLGELGRRLAGVLAAGERKRMPEIAPAPAHVLSRIAGQPDPAGRRAR